jgi:hypothetical protein
VRLTQQEWLPAGDAHVASQDNETVLGEILGMSAAEIRDLTERHVLR